MKKILFAIAFFILSASADAQLKVLTTQGSRFQDFVQAETTGAGPFEIHRIPLDSSEAKYGGMFRIEGVAFNAANGAIGARIKYIGWTVINGVASVIDKTPGYSKGLTGMDIDVVAQGGNIVVTLTGLASATLRYSILIVKLDSRKAF